MKADVSVKISIDAAELEAIVAAHVARTTPYEVVPGSIAWDMEMNQQNVECTMTARLKVATAKQNSWRAPGDPNSIQSAVDAYIATNQSFRSVDLVAHVMESHPDASKHGIRTRISIQGFP